MKCLSLGDISISSYSVCNITISWGLVCEWWHHKPVCDITICVHPGSDRPSPPVDSMLECSVYTLTLLLRFPFIWEASRRYYFPSPWQLPELPHSLPGRCCPWSVLNDESLIQVSQKHHFCYIVKAMYLTSQELLGVNSFPFDILKYWHSHKSPWPLKILMALHLKRARVLTLVSWSNHLHWVGCHN